MPLSFTLFSIICNKDFMRRCHKDKFDSSLNSHALSAGLWNIFQNALLKQRKMKLLGCSEPLLILPFGFDESKSSQYTKCWKFCLKWLCYHLQEDIKLQCEISEYKDRSSTIVCDMYCTELFEEGWDYWAVSSVNNRSASGLNSRIPRGRSGSRM